MPFTQEQITNAIQLLNQTDMTKRQIQRCLSLIALKYQVNGETKTLPETDKQAIETDYQKLKALLKAQVEALP